MSFDKPSSGGSDSGSGSGENRPDRGGDKPDDKPRPGGSRDRPEPTPVAHVPSADEIRARRSGLSDSREYEGLRASQKEDGAKGGDAPGASADGPGRASGARPGVSPDAPGTVPGRGEGGDERRSGSRDREPGAGPEADAGPGGRRPEGFERPDQSGIRRFPGAHDRPRPEMPPNAPSADEVRARRAGLNDSRDYESARAAQVKAEAKKADDAKKQAAEKADEGQAPERSDRSRDQAAERQRSADSQENADGDRERAEQERSDGDDAASRDEPAAPETRRAFPEEAAASGATAADDGLTHADFPRREPGQAEISEITVRPDGDSTGFGETDAGEEGPLVEAGGQDAMRTGSDRGDRADDGNEHADTPAVVAGEVVRDSPQVVGDPAAENVAAKERAGDIRADASSDEAEELRREIAGLKADNAQQRAEIDGLKSEIAEIKDRLRELDPGDEGVLMHAHSEFHGETLDLYTDGTRWRSGEALEEAQKKDPDAGRQGIADVPGVRDQGIDVIGERPDDESELPPSAEGLLEADEGESKLDRLRNKTVRNLSDAVDSSGNQADALRNILNTPPTAHAEVMARPEAGPVVDASPHAGPTVDAVTELAVVTLLVGYQVSGWTRRKVDEIRRRHDGSLG